MKQHDYSLHGGLNRAKVGRYLTLIAASVSAAIVFTLLSVVDVANRFGLNVNLPPSVLSLVGAGMVFAALYWTLDRYAWRWPFLNAALKVPDLAGSWSCEGRSLKPDGSLGYAWKATLTIFQTWDKIRVRLKTDQSGSDSIAAALICDDAEGYRLLYNYRNDPAIGEVDLRSHLGSCMLIFSKDLESAEGEYFNGHGRFTFGTISLKRDHGKGHQ
ncbi:hypothetical protein ML401_35785 (plasmid) [Bradyrhizobium sp. 62B]|uniref:Cap15 family cyclic dinucleotide receptor domain-containing protein n=1 Tax=Bradyrhizobium sp. 62B TaxID=2898442 RepID=UPI002557F1B4|nr:hypothetical protein ML401_35785 [Bradyrhizobium sp. 62B]